MRTRRFGSLPAVALAIGVLLSTAFQAGAAVYTWVDKNGVVHMTDRKDGAPADQVKEIGQPPAPPAEATRRGAILSMISAARNDPRYADLVNIAAEYKRTHSYSMTDYFICVDMSLEMANILKTKGFKPTVMAGNPKVDTSSMDPEKMMTTFNHAWVLVDLGQGGRVAVETTGGFLVDDRLQGFENYYQGIAFENPRQAKETDELIRSHNEDCKKAREMVDGWNERFAGKPVSSMALQAKGQVDAKVQDCLTATERYKELIKAQYRKFY